LNEGKPVKNYIDIELLGYLVMSTAGRTITHPGVDSKFLTGTTETGQQKSLGLTGLNTVNPT